MWLFKTKNNNPQDDKNLLTQQSQTLLKELKLKFQQKLKKLSKNVKQSQQYFQYYSSISKKDQQLIVSFEEMMKTLQGLISIIQQLKKQVDNCAGDLIQLQKLKGMIGNHHNIISTIQQMHSQQINKMHNQHSLITQDFSLKIVEFKQTIKKIQAQKIQVQQKLQRLEQKYTTLQQQNKKLSSQNHILALKYTQKQLIYNKLFDKNAQNKKVININQLKLQYMFYYNRLKQGIFNFLQIKDVLQLKRTNKFYRNLVRNNQTEIIYKKIKDKYQKKEGRDSINMKYYQKILQLFPIENIKNNALKYLYFRIKPAAYILPYLQQEVQKVQILDDKQSQNKAQTKNKFNWRQLFSTQKAKKQENKFSIAQLKNISQFKKIENKIETMFRGLMSFKLPEDLIYYSTTMQNQLKQLKMNMNQKIISKQAYLIWVSQLHCLCKFMYLETNQLYNLLQVVFGQLVIKNKDLINIRQKHDELRQNQGMLRTLIQKISYDKSNIQKKYVLIQNQNIKCNLQKDVISNNFMQIVRECQQIRIKYDNLTNQYKNARKTLQKYEQDKKKYQTNLRSIKEEIDQLQLKNQNRHPRKYSTVSLEQDH